ncbi:hypothetical protein [Stigmatella aurantiaca]
MTSHSMTTSSAWRSPWAPSLRAIEASPTRWTAPSRWPEAFRIGDLGKNLSLATTSALDGLHVDLVRAPHQLGAVIATLGPQMQLTLGLVDGRNVWRTDLDRAHVLAHHAVKALGPERVLVGPSCSLLHVPEDLAVRCFAGRHRSPRQRLHRTRFSLPHPRMAGSRGAL